MLAASVTGCEECLVSVRDVRASGRTAQILAEYRERVRWDVAECVVLSASSERIRERQPDAPGV